ncbi:MAG: hypothetical protein LBI44_01540 [Oscillospiraceae bacterium]|nr:hypothetical protein [Oscillospiraceae bacterium]
MSAYMKDILREIKHTPGRFVSLAVIAALGAASVVGIQATSIDMRLAADAMYKGHNLYDLQIKSTVGFDGDDADALRQTEGVAAVMTTTIFDAYAKVSGENHATRTYALPDGLNLVDVTEGRLPENGGECAVERRLLRDGGYRIGDTVELALDNMDDYRAALGHSAFTITGVVTSPLYITFQRGNTALGDGSLDYYLYLHPSAYTLGVYTDAYVRMSPSPDMDNLTHEYYAAADEWKRRVEQTGAARAKLKSDDMARAWREIYEGREEYESGVSELAERVASARALLDETKAALDEARAELENAQAALDAMIASALSAGTFDAMREQIEAAKAAIDGGWSEYFAGLSRYEGGVAELDAEETAGKKALAEAADRLDEAEEKLAKAPAPEWFVFTRKDGVAFDSYFQDTLRLEKIGYVFPMVFFLVAVMVSLTSMSRMVEEHRTRIGVYKALGYRAAAVAQKYLLYALGAGASGGAAGAVAGSYVFPLIITDAYSHLYDMPPAPMPVPLGIAVAAVVSAVLAVVCVTLGTYMAAMKGSPAVLMRPKPPAGGRRVLLERVPLLWNKMGFFSKVTARNVFRYKRRFIMTLAGVAGCAALLLTAFGLRDSIGGAAGLQFAEVTKYDARAYLKDIADEGQREGLTAALPKAHLFIREEAVDADGPKGGLAASVIIPEDPESLDDYYGLSAPGTKEPVTLTHGGALITDKLARVTGVGEGGAIAITCSNGKAYNVTVTGIVDNYIQHFIYMSPETYADVFGAPALPNSVVMYYDNGRAFAAVLLENENVRALLHNDELLSQIGEQTDAMEIVTVVLIVLACALAFVVLYNLTTINISERVRELATIRVLGFYDSELAMYIYRENALVTLLGVLLGLAGGVELFRFVITSVEIDILKFPHIIRPQSFAYAVALSAAFAVLVNLVMRRKLTGIDMVESLKSAE